MSRNVTVEAHVIVDYPKEMEIITSSHYTLKFGSSDETRTVEVSIDGGPWRECRKTGHYFWFDWTNYMSGRHEIIARARLLDGDVEETAPRHVRVELNRTAR
jgi:hypothetical protein